MDVKKLCPLLLLCCTTVYKYGRMLVLDVCAHKPVLFPLSLSLSLSFCCLVQIVSYTKDSMSVGSSQFKGRVGFISSMPSRDVSLYINNTQESDSGRYLCQIIIPGNPGFTAELSLDVKGKKQIKLERTTYFLLFA